MSIGTALLKSNEKRDNKQKNNNKN